MAGRDCGGRRAGGRLSDLHVDHRQAAALTRICEAIDLDRVERRDPVGGAIHVFNPLRMSASTRARSRRVDAGPRRLGRIRNGDRKADRQRAQLLEALAESSADAGAAASAQCRNAVGVEADVAPRARWRSRLAGLAGAIAIPGNRRTTEIKRHPSARAPLSPRWDRGSRRRSPWASRASRSPPPDSRQGGPPPAQSANAATSARRPARSRRSPRPANRAGRQFRRCDPCPTRARSRSSRPPHLQRRRRTGSARRPSRR